MIKKIYRKTLKLAAICVRHLGTLIKVKPNLILIGAMDGAWYGDNSKYIYNYILKNRPDLQVFWMTRRRQVFSRLKKEGKPVALNFSIKGLFLLYRSRIAFYTNSLLDISFERHLVPDNYQLIALRHGRSVKRVRFARKAHTIPESEKLLRKQEGDMIRYAISTSDLISEIQEECLMIGDEKHIVTGYPRNDFLFNPLFEDITNFKKFVNDVNYDKVILYGPSWRHGRTPTKFFPFDDFDIDTLISFLQENKVLLLLRPHMGDLFVKSEVSDLLNKLAKHSDVIKLATHKYFPDVNTIIPFVDLLISDYSALYHDFLLLDKPLMFIPYDYDDFKIQNGFLYDYLINLPGPNISTFKEFRDYIEVILKGSDPHKEKRRILCGKIHKFNNNNSSQRVVDLLDDILNQ
jgi:CDP-glycerol glycerophosphotransferase (TagB/SpsB family)